MFLCDGGLESVLLVFDGEKWGKGGQGDQKEDTQQQSRQKLENRTSGHPTDF